MKKSGAISGDRAMFVGFTIIMGLSLLFNLITIWQQKSLSREVRQFKVAAMNAQSPGQLAAIYSEFDRNTSSLGSSAQADWGFCWTFWDCGGDDYVGGSSNYTESAPSGSDNTEFLGRRYEEWPSEPGGYEIER